MAQYSLPGDLGAYVRTNPYEQRKQLYSSYGLGSVLGDFSGTAQQNQALYNYVQKQQAQPAPVAPTAPLQPQTAPTSPTSQYTRYAGSPDVFDASGRYISYDEALKNNLFQPGMIQDSPTSRPEVQQEQDYQSYSQQNLQGYQQPQDQGGYSEESQFADFGQQALQLQEALGGTMNASDILSAAENSSDVIMARSRAETLRTRNDEALQRTLAKLGYKAGIDSAEIEAKAMQLKDQLFSQLERSGLFQSGFKDKGVEGIEGFRKSGLEKVKQGLSMAEIEEQARALADREDIDYTLAKTIVQAADAEFKARMKEYEARQDAFNDFLKSQGLAMNPLTGEIFGTAAEKRAQEAQLRADAQLQLAMNRDLRADEQLKISQQRLELSEQSNQRAQERFEATMNKLSSSLGGSTSGSKILTSTQFARLEAAGIPKDQAYDLTTAILSGATLEQIRQSLREDNLNPQLLDTYDRVVGIASLINFKKTGNTEGIANPFAGGQQ